MIYFLKWMFGLLPAPICRDCEFCTVDDHCQRAVNPVKLDLVTGEVIKQHKYESCFIQRFGAIDIFCCGQRGSYFKPKKTTTGG